MRSLSAGQQVIVATQAEAALLEAFRAMTDDARQCAVGMMQSIAKGSPRQKPSLTLVAGSKRLERKCKEWSTNEHP
jgi:hypothetical protein